MSLDVTVHTSVCLGLRAARHWALLWGLSFRHPDSHPSHFSFWSRRTFIHFHCKRFRSWFEGWFLWFFPFGCENSWSVTLLVYPSSGWTKQRSWHLDGAERELLPHPALDLKDRHLSMSSAKQQSLNYCLSSQQSSQNQGCSEGPIPCSDQDSPC